MKRQLAIVLFCAILTSTLASCGGAASADTTAAPVETELTDGLPDTDMNGFEFRIASSTQDTLTWANVQLSADSENGETVNDAIFLRETVIEDRFNCQIVNTLMSYADIYNQYKSIVLAGDNPYDIIMLIGTSVMNNIEVLADLNVLPYVNFDAEW